MKVEKYEFYKALGNPTRLQIVTGLLISPLSVSELQGLTGAQQANVSQHLAKLHHAGIVEAERDGVVKNYSIRRELENSVRIILEAL